VDGPVHDVLVGDRNDYRQTFIETEPYQGGYPDFIKYNSLDEATATRGPPRSSIFDDLCYYHTCHGNLVTVDGNPKSATLFLQKIVASHYMVLAEYNRGSLSSLEWLLSRRHTFSNLTIKWVEERWSDLQSFSRRCEDYRRDLRSILRELRMRDTPGNPSDWMDASQDFLVLEELLLELNKKAQGLVSSFTGLAGIVGNRQSLNEARAVRLLTILGMTFLPLSYASGLFSMTNNYLPGGSQFWVYFAVAIPLLCITFAVPALIGLAYSRRTLRQRLAALKKWANSLVNG